MRLKTIIFSIGLCFYAFCQDPMAYKNEWLGQLPPDFTFKDMNGENFLLSDLKGKVVLLNFWFINCHACKVEYPGLQTLKARFKDPSKVVFLSLPLDGPDLIAAHLKKYPLNFKHMPASGDISQGMFHVLGYPTNFILGMDGKVAHIKVGGSAQSADDIEYEMKELLKKQ